jgi:hypothetical protein
VEETLMPGPWEKYQAAQPGPWTKYQATGDRGEKAIEQANKDAGFFANAGKGLLRGAESRVLGMIQAGADMLPDGMVSPVFRQDMADVARQLTLEGKGTGAGGLVGEIVGDPATAASLPVSGVAGLARAGALAGLTTPNAEATPDASRKERLTGGAIGAGLGAVVPFAMKGVEKAAQPFKKVDGELGRLAGIAAQEGIELTPAQATGSRVLRGVENAFDDLPLTAETQAKVMQGQAKQFNRAALSRAGIDADKATPDVLEAGKNALSQRFEDISSRTSVTVDDDLLKQLATIEAEASKRFGKDEAKAVTSFVDDVLSSGGVIDGATYQNTRSILGQLANGTKDGFKSTLLKDMQAALDDAAFRSLSPEDAAVWQTLRKQYSAYKTIEKAMSRTGQAALEGNISPAALAQAIKTGNKGYATGSGELNNLARAGAAFLRDPVANSGTAKRLAWQTVLSGGGLAAGGPMGLAASVIAPKALQVLYNSAAGKKLLTEGLPGVAKAAQEAGRVGGIAGVIGAGRPSQSAPEVPATPIAPQQEPPLGDQSAVTSPLLDRMVQAESGGDPAARNPNGSASGLLQFTNDTWAKMVARYGKQTGITLKDKDKAEAQKIMGELLTRDNGRILSKQLGREPTDGELYAAHFLGAPDAVKLIKAQGSGRQAITLFPRRVVADNRSVFFDGQKPRTVEQVMAIISGKVV